MQKLEIDLTLAIACIGICAVAVHMKWQNDVEKAVF